MNDEVIRFLTKLEHLKRTTWIPVIEAGDGERTDSKISGVPWLSKDEEWPICPRCKKEMQFFLQVNLDHSPSEVKNRHGTGILQMFYCTNFPCRAEGARPFTNTELIRIIHPTGEPKDVEMPDFEWKFPPKKVVDWIAQDDYPTHNDDDVLSGENLDDNELKLLTISGYSLRGEKLSGYPHWKDWSNRPKCPACQKKMELLFQVESERLIPHNFGDAGTGWISQCPDHKETVAFGWQSS